MAENQKLTPDKILNMTVNEFFDMVLGWYQIKDPNTNEIIGDDYFIKRANELKWSYKKDTTAYCVLAPLLACADDEIIAQTKDVVKTEKNGWEKPKSKSKSKYWGHREVYQLVKNGCQIKISDGEAEDPNQIRGYLTTSLGTFEPQDDATSPIRPSLRKEITGKTTVKDALKIIEDLVEGRAKQVKYKEYHKMVETLFYTSNKGSDTATMSNQKYDQIKKNIETAIKNGAKQIILTGAPGTGKTKMAREIAIALGFELKWKHDISQENRSEQTKKAPQYELVQFHPSYDYTDFVEGLRPVENKNENGEICFKKLDGIFKSFCRRVAEQNAKNAEKVKNSGNAENLDNSENTNNDKKIGYFFLIDEINRADLSKVFGELMYCLESDKRGPEYRIQTQYQNLTQSYTKKDETELTRIKGKPLNDIFADGFYIPENVYIIGTMNDIDRSVENMDFALRRRFLWKEVEVTDELLTSAFSNMEQFTGICGGEHNHTAHDIASRVMKLNHVMLEEKYAELGLNKQYFISQGQFAGLPESCMNKLQENEPEPDLEGFLKEVFEWRIEPLLREYVRGEDARVVHDFLEDCEKALCPQVDPSNAEDAQS